MAYTLMTFNSYHKYIIIKKKYSRNHTHQQVSSVLIVKIFTLLDDVQSHTVLHLMEMSPSHDRNVI